MVGTLFDLLAMPMVYRLSFWASFFLSIYIQLQMNEAKSVGNWDHANTPPRGWNSYDSFCWNINETEFLDNAKLVAQRLSPYGYEYVVVDFLWYRRKDMPGVSTNSLGTDTIDEWGRMVPDPSRWPSTHNGIGFTKVAEIVHQMGLKFGIHVMKGLSLQAYNANAIILDSTKGEAYEEGGKVWRAKDIGIKHKVCKWMDQGFMAVNTSLGAGRAFLRSLYSQYDKWGVDFVKNDCVFGDDFDMDEISYVSELLREFERPIIYSLSPGTNAKPELAKKVNGLVNMYRVTADDWDQWDHVKSHFNVSRDFAAANMIGAEGLKGRSWPNLDMLPLGWLSNANSNEGPHRQCNLTIEEQKTQVTLWSMAKSPFIFGGDMRRLDDTTFGLITHPVLLEINSFSSNNHEFSSVSGSSASGGTHQVVDSQQDADVRAWIATGRSGETYLAFFNLSTEKMAISAKRTDVLSSVGVRKEAQAACQGREVWTGKDVREIGESISMEVEPHGTALFLLKC